MNSSPLSQAEALAGALIEGLRNELYLTPKPGLVDRRDNGSHPDLSLATMEASIRLVESYLRRLLEALAAGADLDHLVRIGRQAERRMFEELGTNTHKGAIFLCGLLVAARTRLTTDRPEALRDAVAELAGEFFREHSPAATHGDAVRARFGLGGVVKEALNGLPALFDIALPAWREAVALNADDTVAAFFVMARLMQHVEDTTALHRCGETGLARLRRDGRAIEKLIAAGQDPRQPLSALNEEYRTMHLTMGGVADLLGIASGYLAYCGAGGENQAPNPSYPFPFFTKETLR